MPSGDFHVRHIRTEISMDYELLKIVGAALLSGILSPLILSLFNHGFVWRQQKLFDLKYRAYETIIEALGAYESDSLNPAIQDNKYVRNGRTRSVELKPETETLIHKADGLAMSFFTVDTYKLVDIAFKFHIQIDSPGAREFKMHKLKAIMGMGEELKIFPSYKKKSAF